MRTCGLNFITTLLIILTPTFALSNITSIHHSMIVHLDPQKHFLEVNNEMQITGEGEAIFRLAPSLVISSIKKDGQPINHTRQEETFRFQLGSKKQYQISLRYKGVLPGLPNKNQGLRNISLMTSEKGSYLSSWSAWHPYVEDITSTYHLKIIIDENHKAIVPGRLIEENTTGGFYNAVFESEIPATGIVLIAGRFIVKERRHKKILLRTYFSSEISDLADKYLESTIEHIEYFESLIGDYPFSSFSIISGPLPVGLGFSGLTYIGETVLRLPFIRFTSLAHEVLHNWWGNGVKVDYKEGNWAEGLTTYMADYALSAKRNVYNGRRMRQAWLRDYSSLPPQRDMPVRSFISKKHDASQIIGYKKAAFIFHMLSNKVGKESFENSIRRFWRAYKSKTASWEDIQKTFEETTGLDLQIFFQQWVNRKGAPRLEMSKVFFGAKKLSFRLLQPEPPYSLDIPIKISTKSGIKSDQIRITRKNSKIDLRLSEPPISIEIDPNFNVFRKLGPNETSPILRDITLNSNSIVFLISSNKNLRNIAKKLATRILDNPPTYAEETQISNHENPKLIIGTTPEVSRYLQENGLPTTPKSLLGLGSARVWTTRHLSQKGKLFPLLIIEANDTRALKYLLKPLPHYGRNSYLIFNSATVIDSGTWPAKHNPLSATLRFKQQKTIGQSRPTILK